MKKSLVAVIAAGALLVLGGVAWASIPGPDGVIHGCYKTGNPARGSVMVIDSAASCPSGFAPLEWNQTGPQGPPGVSEWEVLTASDIAEQLPDGRWEADTSAFCPLGKKALSGGFVYESDETWPNVTVTENIPSGTANNPDGGWNAAVVADVPGTLRIRVICAVFL
jgi:hypothetical protein